MQRAFDPLDYQDNFHCSIEEAVKLAKQARNKELAERRKLGQDVKGWSLTGQLKPYASFGVPDGRVRTVFYLSVFGPGRAAYSD